MEFGKSDDFETGLGFGGEGQEACVEGSSEGRGDEVGDLRVVGKFGFQSGTLLLPLRCEIWVMDSVIGFVEVVVAFCVTDAVDGCFAHAEKESLAIEEW